MNKRELDIAAAEAEVEERRARLLETVDELSDLFEPRKIVQEVWDTAKDKGADIAGDAVEAVKRRPVAATGIVAALTMFLAREPIKDGIVSMQAGGGIVADSTPDGEYAESHHKMRGPLRAIELAEQMEASDV